MWHISAGNPAAEKLVALFLSAMRLSLSSCLATQARGRTVELGTSSQRVSGAPYGATKMQCQCAPPLASGAVTHLTVYVQEDGCNSAGGRAVSDTADVARYNHHTLEPSQKKPVPPNHAEPSPRELTCTVATFDASAIATRLRWLGQAIALDTECRGGVLLHGGLAERNGRGIILAGPGDRGKTTASERLPHPWHSLSDDATLVLPDRAGKFWAHPWPTWSHWLDGHADSSWDVQHAVPLDGVFFLVQAPRDSLEPLGAGHAVPLLVETTKQVGRRIAREESGLHARALQTRRFDNLCTLARAVPAYTLHLTLTGAFWQEIERVLEGA